METFSQPTPKSHQNLLVRLAGRQTSSLENRFKKRRFIANKQTARATELHQLASFGRLSANLLHEISNPLSAALLYLEQDDQKVVNSVDEARKNLHQLERYIKAARQQLIRESSIVTFSVQAQLFQLMHILKPLAHDAGVRLVVDQVGRHSLLGDPIKFQQLLANLIMNAIEAYDGQAPLGSKVQITIHRTGPWLVLIVTDFGKGITSTQLPRLFEPFYSTKAKSGRGLGLGLALVKQIVESDFHGRINATSSPYTGTQFMVKLVAFDKPIETECVNK